MWRERLTQWKQKWQVSTGLAPYLGDRCVKNCNRRSCELSNPTNSIFLKNILTSRETIFCWTRSHDHRTDNQKWSDYLCTFHFPLKTDQKSVSSKHLKSLARLCYPLLGTVLCHFLTAFPLTFSVVFLENDVSYEVLSDEVPPIVTHLAKVMWNLVISYGNEVIFKEKLFDERPCDLHEFHEGSFKYFVTHRGWEEGWSSVTVRYAEGRGSDAGVRDMPSTLSEEPWTLVM